MPKFSFITSSLKNYDYDKTIVIYASDGKKTHKINVKGFLFYFFVREEDYIPDMPEILSIEEGYIHKNGFKVKKINCVNNAVIKTLKNRLKYGHGIESFEADIPPIRRLKINTKIFNDFEIESHNFTNVHWTDLKPVELKTPFIPHYIFIDFEIRTETRFPDPKKPNQPCTAWCAWSSSDKTYYQAVLNENLESDHVVEWIKDDWCCLWCKTEKTLLKSYDLYLRSHSPHIIAHYNGKVVDMRYPFERAKKYGITLPLEEFEECDVCECYRALFNRLYNRLKDIAVEEGIFKPNQLVAEEYHGDMEKEDIRKFGAYNKLDTEILVTLNSIGWQYFNDIDGSTKSEPPRMIVEFFWELRNFIALESIDASIHSGTLVDTLMLRKAFDKQIVLNSSLDGEGERYPGAIIFSPKPKLYNLMQLIDMSRYYPNIIIGYNIDELACEVVLDLVKKREEVEIEQSKYEPNTPDYNVWEKRLNRIKYTTNATYGYMGSPRSRLYEREKAAKITNKARLGLTTIINAIEAKTPDLLAKLTLHTGFTKGFPVLYSHTDSVGVQCSREDIKKIVYYINEIVLKELCKNEGIPNLLRLKHEKEARRVIFVTSKTNDKVAKSRYAMWITFEKGQEADYIDIIGLEYVRNNASKITRKLQMTILKDILKEDKNIAIPYLQKLIVDIKNGVYPLSDLAIPITLSKHLDKYTKMKPDFIKASLWSIKNLGLEIVGGDRIKLIPVKSVETKEPTNLIAFFEEQDLKNLKIHVDYDKIIEKTVKSKVEQFLNVIGIQWEEVKGIKKLSNWKFE